MMNIYNEVVKRGIEHSTHSPDLCIPANEETEKLIVECNVKNARKFYNVDIDNKPWFEIPDAYEPFWIAVGKSK